LREDGSRKAEVRLPNDFGPRSEASDFSFFILAIPKYICNPPYYNARVAELVDAADSKSAVRKDVLVRFQSRAQKP
jgi:hypothetical protein